MINESNLVILSSLLLAAYSVAAYGLLCLAGLVSACPVRDGWLALRRAYHTFISRIIRALLDCWK